MTPTYGVIVNIHSKRSMATNVCNYIPCYSRSLHYFRWSDIDVWPYCMCPKRRLGDKRTAIRAVYARWVACMHLFDNSFATETTCFPTLSNIRKYKYGDIAYVCFQHSGTSDQEGTMPQQTRSLDYHEIPMPESMIVNKDFKPGIWLAGSIVASRSEAMLENSCLLTRISTCIFAWNPSRRTGLALNSAHWTVLRKQFGAGIRGMDLIETKYIETKGTDKGSAKVKQVQKWYISHNIKETVSTILSSIGVVTAKELWKITNAYWNANKDYGGWKSIWYIFNNAPYQKDILLKYSFCWVAKNYIHLVRHNEIRNMPSSKG